MNDELYWQRDEKEVYENLEMITMVRLENIISWLIIKGLSRSEAEAMLLDAITEIGDHNIRYDGDIIDTNIEE